MSDQTSCSICRRPSKSNPDCGICHAHLCKKCAQVVSPDAFQFKSKPDAELSHGTFCSACFQSKVEGALAEYEELLGKAKEVHFFFVNHKGRLPVVEQAKKKISVESCRDRDETILRLGFLAAELGYDAVVQGDVAVKKVRMGAYQTADWVGSGYPAMMKR